MRCPDFGDVTDRATGAKSSLIGGAGERRGGALVRMKFAPWRAIA
jgi:hypothetical protein